MWSIDGILGRWRKAGSSGIKVALQIPFHRIQQVSYPENNHLITKTPTEA